MKVEMHVNGSIQLIVIPENYLERAIIAEIVNRSSLGKKVSVVGRTPTNSETNVALSANLIVSVEA